MENKKEILLIAQKLTELRLKQKMLKWAFENSKGLPEEKMNAILDENRPSDKNAGNQTKRIRKVKTAPSDEKRGQKKFAYENNQ